MVNGGGTDYSARNTEGIHVLLTMDESTYAEADGSDGVDDDHPIAWCHRYDGGRAWYTGLGHTEASYLDAGFLAAPAGRARGRGRLRGRSGVRRRRDRRPRAASAASVPATLSLTLGAPGSFGTFIPGVAQTTTRAWPPR